MALWSPGPGGGPAAGRGGAWPARQFLFYKRTDPEFMTQAQQILEGRQIFAQLRLEQPTLSRSFFYPFVLIYGVILLLSLAFALLMAERLSDPIRRLARGANIVAQGDWAYRLKTGAGGEIGHLVTAFNDMVSRLDTQRRRLIDMEKMTAWRDVARHLAHEIKNPLLPIRLTVEEMKDQYKGGDPGYQSLVDDSARVVREEIDHLQSLVKEFSSFARMPELNPRRGSLEVLVCDVATLYGQIPVHVQADPSLGETTFDPDQIRRAVVNLMDNAAAAVTDTPDPSIRIRLDRGADDAVLEISDNGSGISSDVIARVFEPYFTTKREGSGLGLAMVKNIVLLHGGTIDVSSEPGKGTTFVVALPLGGPENLHDVRGPDPVGDREQI
jgi:nitrogen fixation/metabolism regulation signal transduction histidine kinase